ncbi:unnamed protein product [Triticum turgidum subsp. durum]|uniref:Uncharacterized protein n=1 Tax=Triticum turgidum subsp. durum TaxID=4567 RepID=A0A9R0Q760_TRITD|nr:unnamed protein product [Triticum turgidum subsp. durum]
MAPSLLAAAASASPFLLHGAAGSASRRPVAPGRRAASSVRVHAAIKCDPSKVEPQSDRVLVRLETIPEKSAGGVLLPKSAVKFERYLMGEILSVGVDVSEVEAGKKVSGFFFSQGPPFNACPSFSQTKEHRMLAHEASVCFARWSLCC